MTSRGVSRLLLWLPVAGIPLVTALFDGLNYGLTALGAELLVIAPVYVIRWRKTRRRLGHHSRTQGQPSYAPPDSSRCATTGENISLRDYLLESFTQRSFGEWREMRATRREVAAAVLVLALLGYALWILYWSGIENHCLWDHYGSRCQGGGGH